VEFGCTAIVVTRYLVQNIVK